MQIFTEKENHIFGGIQNYQSELPLLLAHVKKLIISSGKSSKYVDCYHIFGNLIVSCDRSNIQIQTDSGSNIIVGAISGEILHIEHSNDGKYYVYQSTPDRLIVDEITTNKDQSNSSIIRKDFIINIKNPEQIKNMSTSENFFVFIDKDCQIHMAPRSSVCNTEKSISISMQAYIEDKLKFTADENSIQVFEYKDYVIIYLHNQQEKIIYRLCINKKTYSSYYDVIDIMENCEYFDGRAMFFLDSFMQQNPDFVIDLANVTYLRNNGDSVIIGIQKEENKEYLLLSTKDSSKVTVICKFVTPADFRLERLIPVNFQDQRVFIAIQVFDDCVKFIPYSYKGIKLSEPQTFLSNKTQTVILLSQKEIRINGKSSDLIDAENAELNDNLYSNEQENEEYTEEYEFDFEQIVNSKDAKKDIQHKNSDNSSENSEKEKSNDTEQLQTQESNDQK